MNNISLNIRKTMDGNILIKDHPRANIIVSPNKKKIIILTKDEINDDIYACQQRMIKLMTDKGVIDFGSEQGGNVYGSIEMKIPQPDDGMDPIQPILSVIQQFIKSEKEIYDEIENYKKEVERMYMEPDEEESTELGEVPHEKRKGSIPQDTWGRYNRMGAGYYGYNY